MARGDKDYGDEGKTSFSKKSKMAPVASPRAKAKPAVSTKSVAAPVRPKAKPSAPASSPRPMTANKKAADVRGNMAADVSLMNKASAVKKPEAMMSRQERKKAGLPVSPLGKMMAKVNARATAIAAKKAAEEKK
jgi:hypothetical protein